MTNLTEAQLTTLEELSASEEYTPSFPPVSDTIVWIKQVDWEDVRLRCKGGINNVGLVLAVIGEKVHDLGVFLGEL